MSPFIFARLGKRVFLKVGVATTILATGQAIYLRNWYENTPLLSLPSHMKGIEYGIETVCIKMGFEKEKCTSLPSPIISPSQWISNEMEKIRSLLTSWSTPKSLVSKEVTRTKDVILHKKVRLLILGDSLARGVGCSNTSPMLPTALARLLSLALKVDVEWRAEGLIGGTVGDIHQNYLPIISEELHALESQDTDLVIVLICGLNDWKTMLTKFPWGSGPTSFHDQLTNLVSDIKVMAGERSFKIFLPALPLACGAADPNCILQQAPLKYFVDTVCSVWDMQKRFVAEAAPGSAVFIDMPSVDVSYATPGEGNVCSDGVHPSSQGYLWWATHIANSIIDSHALERKN